MVYYVIPTTISTFSVISMDIGWGVYKMIDFPFWAQRNFTSYYVCQIDIIQNIALENKIFPIFKMDLNLCFLSANKRRTLRVEHNGLKFT